MTLTAPSSRQGRFALALTIVFALAAVVGGLFWYNSASANLPATTVNLTQSPAAGANVNPGDAVTYTMTTTTVGANDNGAVIMRIVLGAGLDAATSNGTCPAAATGGVGITWALGGAGTATLTCTSSAILTASMTNATMTVTANVAAAATTVATPGTTDVRDTSNNPVAATRAASVGALNVAGVSVNPASATNLIGQAHTITWTLPAGYTCESDADFADTLRSCDATDVDLSGGTATVTSGPTVSDPDLDNQATVTVVINGTASDTTTVTLLTKFQDDDVAFIETPNVSADKEYQTLAQAGDAQLVHVDVDDASEDAAATLQDDLDADRSIGERGGVLDGVQDDNDDATGSLHTACLISAFLGAADNGLITWDIDATAGSLATVSPAGGIEVILNIDSDTLDDSEANCVQWRSGGVGGQTITATYTGTGEVIGFDVDDDGEGVIGDDTGAIGDPADAPLIKQWNDIDDTKIVQADTRVGADLCDKNDICGDISDNTGEFSDWGNRDCTSRTTEMCANSDVDGLTLTVGAPAFSNGTIWADGVGFIDYTFGDHAGLQGIDYDGPVDGVEQTYSVDADCGAVRLENPVTGEVHVLFDNDSVTILTSDKGVGFKILPTYDGSEDTNIGNADCEDGDQITVRIDSEEDVQLNSAMDDADREIITVEFVHGPGANKQPQLAWVGQRVVLEWDWSEPDGKCPWNDLGNSDAGGFWVRYVIQHPSPGTLSTVPDEEPAVVTGPDFIVVWVDDSDLAEIANDDCISRVIYESQEYGEVDVTAHVVSPDACFLQGTDSIRTSVLGEGELNWTVCSPEYDFLVYYMKLEDVTLTADAETSVVSTDVELTATVRGWTLLNGGANCPAANVAGVDQNGGVLPAGRCIFPDDWNFLAGGDLAMISNPNMDIYGGSGGSCADRAGPFSLLDGPLCGDSSAPHADSDFREANWPNGTIDEDDAPMPPAEIFFAIDMFDDNVNDSGFLHAADKATSNTEAWDSANIPAEPWINTSGYQTNGGGNYLWDSFDDGGDNTGVYHFWEIADHSTEVISCPGASPCPGVGVPTGGYKSIYVYSDNHGVAKALINGDADLTFDECLNSADNADAPHDVAGDADIKQITGFFCDLGDLVGTSEVDVIANYPDKQGKHYPLSPDAVTIEWTWGGIKQITVEQTAGDQFSYVILHVTDRDGFCGNSPSLHPVLGERVDWLLDSGDGTIVDGEILISLGILGQSATTETFDPDSVGVRPAPGPRIDEDECQTWIQVVSTLLNEVNVLITAHDPEGRVIFDVKLNVDGDNDGVRDADDNCPTTYNPDQADNNGFEDGTGAGDACEVIPTPTPNTATDLWGDVDCDSDVDSADAMKVLQTVVGIPISQTGPCHAMGDSITVNGTARKFGDWNCDGNVTSVDALAILRYIVSNPLTSGGGCPVVGVLVDIS